MGLTLRRHLSGVERGEDMNRIVRQVAFALLVGMSCANSAFAQVDVSTAKLKGTVTDQSSSLVRGATVMAISVERAVIRHTTTDA
jgi:hypothetical protein